MNAGGLRGDVLGPAVELTATPIVLNWGRRCL